MTPNVIRAKIKRLEARKPSLSYWANKKPDKFREMALENIKFIEDEIKQLEEMLNDSENRNAQGEISKES